jgi:hypothetical protein
MSDSSIWNRWIGGCVTTGWYGCTSGDGLHKGLEYYREPFSCPNGLTWTGGDPLQLPSHRERIAKAKADIARISRDWRVVEAAELISISDIKDDVEAIRKWANSLQQNHHQSDSGSTGLTQRGPS